MPLRSVFLFMLCLYAALSASAQSVAPSGNIALPWDGPPTTLFTKYVYVSGSDTYVCYSSQVQRSQYTMTNTSTVGGATTSLVFSGGHDFHADANPQVTISGGTGNWAALNGTRPATYVNATTLTVAVDSSGFGAVTGTIVVKSSAPRISQPAWAVLRVRATGSNSTALWSTAGWNSSCTDRATLSYQ